MKGLQPLGNPNTVYLSVKDGTICQDSKVPREGFEPVEITDQSTGDHFTKYRKYFKGVEAMVTDIEFRNDVYDGRPYISWRISLQADEGPPMVLELPFNSSVADRFMRCAENIDFTRPVEFRAWRERESKKTAFMIGQRVNEADEKAVNVPQLYTKENPGDCPPARQRFDKTWDFEAQKEFLYQRMMEVVIPHVHASQSGLPKLGSALPNDSHPADPFVPGQNRTESRSEPSSGPAPGDDPFVRPKQQPAASAPSQGSATGSAGPITEITLEKLKGMARAKPEVDFNSQAISMFQRGVTDLTEGQAVALIYYMNVTYFAGAL